MIRNVLLLVCGLCISIDAGEYRAFTDSAGRNIEAKVLKLDLKTNVVELELRNGKKGRIPLSNLALTDSDKIFFNELKISSIFSDPKKLLVSISEETSPHYNKATKKNGKQHTYTFTLTNLSEIDFAPAYIEYCIYRDLGNKENRSTNLELPAKDLLAGKSLSVQTTQTHATFKSSGKMSISGLRLRLFYKLSDGSYAVREQCFPKSLPLDTFPWARSSREMEEERRSAPDPAGYPVRDMSESEILDLAQTYAEVWRENDFETWKRLLYPMHVGRQELEPGWFERTADRIKFVKILEVNGRNVKMRVTHEKKDDEEGWLQITPSGHIKYTPLIFEHPFIKACGSTGMLGSSWPHFREESMESLKKMKVPLFNYNPAPSKDLAAVNQVVGWLSAHRSSFDISEPHVYLPDDEALAALERTRNMLRFFNAN